jgi:glyoxylase-like metal-dependent hydrolase (beta-lactamase superfamily II)
MEAFRQLYGGGHGRVATLPFDNHASPASEFAAISAGFEQIPGKLDAVIYFGHGEPFGMVSSDIYDQDIQKFAQLIKRKCVHGVRVVLYACNCGRVDHPGGSFAAKLATALSDIEAVVFGHDDVGHTVTNAHIYRYSGGGRGVAVAPTGKLIAFDRMLKAESLDQKPKGNNAFWARMPFMTPAEVRAEVAK